MNSTVAPTVHSIEAKPGHRLVPALVGTRASNQIAYIACPNWCVDDHTDCPTMLDDIDHNGATVGVVVPTYYESDDDHAWSARLMADPNATDPRSRAAHLAVGDETRFEARLAPSAAEKLADELVGFAAQLRQLARTARLHNQTAGDSDPSMDEALRRLRADKWRSLSDEDIAALPIVRLLKAFGVMVVEYDIAGVELLGEPGHMELRVGRATRQQLRDSEARRLIAEYAAGARRV
ncbi:hypothetical protein [Streptomyces sp. NPDC002685]|uniref:DUF6907 domain-containing protein n=1 Tax=Streptomyces sp. NPDC002685 TaxID=3154540 RepID=UPI0033237B60